MDNFKNLIGMSKEKKELELIADILKNRKNYSELGAAIPRGLLITGPTGCGKTLAAQCLMDYCGMDVYDVREGSEALEKTIRSAFTRALSSKGPAIIFIDDIDSIFNGNDPLFDSEEKELINGLYKIDVFSNLFILATAEDMNIIPNSVLNTGRLNWVIQFRDPEGKDCEEVVKVLMDEKSFSSNVDQKLFAHMVNGCSFPVIRHILNDAALIAGYKRRKKISMDHILEAYTRNVINDQCKYPELLGKNKMVDLTDKNSMQAYVVFHEAGHAAVSEILCPGCVTVVSAPDLNNECQGFTSYYDNQPQLPLGWMEQRLMSVLGGRAAIELVFGKPDPGSSKDLDIAFKFCSDMVREVCTCGMDKHNSCAGNSQALLEKQENTVAAEMDRYYRKTKELLAEKWEFFIRIAEELASKRIITAVDIERIRNSLKTEKENNHRSAAIRNVEKEN